MSLIQVNELRQKVNFIESFKGYNHTLRADLVDSYDRAEFYDMRSMSLDNYPAISTRKGETELFKYPGTPTQIWQYKEDTYLVISGGYIYTNVTRNSTGDMLANSGDYIKPGKKYFAQIGSKTVIMPDKVTFDMETGEFSKIEKNYESASFTSSTGNTYYVILMLEPCTIDGETFSYTKSATAPSNTSVYWYDTTDNCVKKYSEAQEKWVKVTMNYMCVTPIVSTSTTEYSFPKDWIDVPADAKNLYYNLVKMFKAYSALDTMTIGFCELGKEIEAETADNIIYGKASTGMVILNGIAKTKCTGFVVKNRCPDLTHICSNNNRVWGVSNDTHEIFACKLGDCTQWYNYAGIAGDSYALSLGNPDEVTACAAYGNYILFFTENRIMKIYGDYPSNYQLYTVKASGVRKGAEETVVQISGGLYYVSELGVMVYDGSYPSVISKKLGNEFLTEQAVAAGKHGAKYCLSVNTGNATSKGMYIYDTQTGFWVRGSSRLINNASTMDSKLCFVTDDNRLVTLSDYKAEEDSIAVTGEDLLQLASRERIEY